MFLILEVGVLLVAVFSVVMLFLTLISGIRLLNAEKTDANYAERKKNFRSCGIVFLLSLAAAAGLLALAGLVGSQITFSM